MVGLRTSRDALPRWSLAHESALRYESARQGRDGEADSRPPARSISTLIDTLSAIIVPCHLRRFSVDC